MKEQNYPIRFARLLVGFVLSASGVSMMIRANIGYAPWEVFASGFTNLFGIPVGRAGIYIGLAITALTALFGEPVGLGTILNIILIGTFTDMILEANILPFGTNVWMSLVMMSAGLLLIALGAYFYMGGGMGSGPRDGLMVLLVRKTHLPAGVIRSGVELTAVVLGYLMGGELGYGTVYAAFGAGVAIQIVFSVLHFHVDEVHHETVRETCGKLFAGRQRNHT